MPQRARGVHGGTSPDQGEGGGSIPARALHFQVGDERSAKELVMRYHYSRRWPSNVQLIGSLHEAGGLFGDFGLAMAAVIFTIPPTRWSEPVLELARLVRREPARVPLTLLIRLAVSRLKVAGADLLVSFADAQHGHHGGIYQACRWEFAGKRDRRMDGVLLDGNFITGRRANHLWGTRSPVKLRERLTDSIVEPSYDEGKYLYWKALNRAGKAKAERLKLQSLPYPKPHQEATT